jgi:hypothetical protein
VKTLKNRLPFRLHLGLLLSSIGDGIQVDVASGGWRQL